MSNEDQKVVPLTLNSPAELMLELQDMDMSQVKNLALVAQFKGGEMMLTHSAMSVEVIHYFGGVLQHHAISVASGEQ